MGCESSSSEGAPGYNNGYGEGYNSNINGSYNNNVGDGYNNNHYKNQSESSSSIDFGNIAGNIAGGLFHQIDAVQRVENAIGAVQVMENRFESSI